MGNVIEECSSKYALDDKTMQYAEMQLILCSGLPRNQIQQLDVKVGTFGGKDVDMRTVIIGDPNKFATKPTLVLVHGFAGSGALFYKTFKGLSDHFRLILLDMIGMGSSSRPDNFDHWNFTAQQSIEYFIEYIEQWRKAMKLPSFILMGHSFGSYIVGNYAIKYHQYIEKLILVSPVGIREQPAGETWQERMERREKQGKGPSKFLKQMMHYIWEQRISPFEIGRIFGQRQAMRMIDDYVKDNQETCSDSEKQIVNDYIYQIIMRSGTTEYVMPVLFNPGLQAYLPLGTKDKLASPNFPISISFVYGDRDWVLDFDEDAASECIQQNSKKHGKDKSKIHECSNAGHQMQMDNPDEFIKIVLQDVFARNGQ